MDPGHWKEDRRRMLHDYRVKTARALPKPEGMAQPYLDQSVRQIFEGTALVTADVVTDITDILSRRPWKYMTPEAMASLAWHTLTRDERSFYVGVMFVAISIMLFLGSSVY